MSEGFSLVGFFMKFQVRKVSEYLFLMIIGQEQGEKYMSSSHVLVPQRVTESIKGKNTPLCKNFLLKIFS